ncbi:MAG: gamma-glutamyltransferase, partial [Flavobacteriia bacterium]|nr:gamma-glutamyltransferase [Flavobacteriia bacterium]
MLVALVSLSSLAAQSQSPTVSGTPQSGPAVHASAVATAHPLATQVAAGILKQGGNAYDAAVAAHFALAVVLPRAGNLGGGGFAVVHTGGGEAASLDFRETAPQAASRETYLPSDQTISSLRGIAASGIPGSVGGMWELYARFGSKSLSWPELLQPAILLADTGFQITPFLASLLNGYQA